MYSSGQYINDGNVLNQENSSSNGLSQSGRVVPFKHLTLPVQRLN
jgi:hypothetical protein